MIMKKQFKRVISTMFAIVFVFAMSGTVVLADLIYQLDETFVSGATFSGRLTFVDDGYYNTLIGVNGVLTGGAFGPSPDPITWTWYDEQGGMSVSMGGNVYADFLMDGTPGNYQQFIEIDWRHTGGGNLVLDNSAGTAGWILGKTIPNAINYTDQMISYSFTPVAPTPTPEPATMLLFSAGVAGLAGAGIRKMKQSER
jgi:hypothetical protein